MTGKIARVTDRGFGFITPDDGQKDVFFHAKDLNGVEFNDLKEEIGRASCRERVCLAV